MRRAGRQGTGQTARARPAQLWSGKVARVVFDYTAGPDQAWDGRLLHWDILGSLGHVEGLRASRLLTAAQHQRLRGGLRSALRAARGGKLRFGRQDEDVHTTVEAWLTRRLGAVGEMVHTGRSRNDQIACDLRLYLKDRVLSLHGAGESLIETLLALGRRERRTLWPGYTHQRRGMPSTVGLWAAGQAAGLLDSLDRTGGFWPLLDRSPLGSAAGYGVPLPLKREAAARALGFSGLDVPVTAVQNGRGKLEADVLFWAVQLAHDVSRLSSDLILYSSEEFGYFRLPEELTTGSSIMPQKRNPDVFELTRARCALLEGDLAACLALRARLTGGYHRDFQLLKEPLFRGLDRLEEVLGAMAYAVPRLGVDRERCRDALANEVFATDEVMRRVESGVPFRAAYRSVAAEVRAGVPVPEPNAAGLIRRRRSTGGAGNPGFALLARRLRAARSWRERTTRRFEQTLRRLAGGAIR